MKDVITINEESMIKKLLGTPERRPNSLADIEESPNNRARCYRCHKKINEHEIRMWTPYKYYSSVKYLCHICIEELYDKYKKLKRRLK